MKHPEHEIDNKPLFWLFHYKNFYINNKFLLYKIFIWPKEIQRFAWGHSRLKLIPYESWSIFTYQVTDHLYVFAHPTVDCKEHISIMIPRYPHFIWHSVIEKYLFESLEFCLRSLLSQLQYQVYYNVYVKLSFQGDNFLVNAKNWWLPGNKYQQK